jgi:short-subunit dehydrogenase
MGFNRTLRMELKGTNVGVSSVHPGGVRTNAVRNARWVKKGETEESHLNAAEMFEKTGMTSADKAAKTIIKGIRKNKYQVLIGSDAYLLDLLSRHTPGLLNMLIQWGMERGK